MATDRIVKIGQQAQLLTMTGQLQAGEMFLLGDGLMSEGQQSRARGIRKPLSDGVARNDRGLFG
jgi:hypothetical protein